MQVLLVFLTWSAVQIAEVRNYFNTHKKQYEEQAEKLQATREPTDVPGSALLFGASKPASRAEIMSSFPSRYTTDILVARYFGSYDPATRKSLIQEALSLVYELIENQISFMVLLSKLQYVTNDKLPSMPETKSYTNTIPV